MARWRVSVAGVVAIFLAILAACTESLCPRGQTDCSGACTDLASSTANCGLCGVACGGGQACLGGACISISAASPASADGGACPAGTTLCGDTCVTTQFDPQNCGGCGVVCAAGQVCGNGQCGASCPTGLLACGGSCINPSTSRTNCGATGDCAGLNAGAACASGQVCANGVCSTSCPTGQLACGGACIIPQTDLVFCGATGDCLGPNAGVPCAPGDLCVGGTCATTCPFGQINCGTCTNPATDRTHCGAVGDCLGPNAGVPCPDGQVCSNGACVASCQFDLIDCGGGCVNPANDPLFCGATPGCGGPGGGTPGQNCGFNACVAGACQPVFSVPPPNFLWFDASDLATITQDGNGNVSEWRDKSGLGRNAATATTSPQWLANQTPSGAPAIAFDGATVGLQTASLTSVAEMTIFVVFSLTNPQPTGALFQLGTDTHLSVIRYDCCGPAGGVGLQVQGGQEFPFVDAVVNNWTLLTFVRQGTTSTVRMFGGPLVGFAGDTLNPGDQVQVEIGNANGGSRSMGGLIAEIRAFDSVLPPVLQTAIELDLAIKYGL